MKKILALALSLLVLTACTDSRVKPATNEVLFTIDGREVKEANWFEVMKRTDSGALIMNKSDVALSKDVEDESIDKKVEEQLAQAKETLGDTFLETLQSLGFESEEVYKEDVLYPQYRMEFLIKQSMEENYEALAKEYQPKKARIVQFDTKENADTALERIKAGEEAEAVATDLGTTSANYSGKETIYNIKGTEFPSPVSSFITKQIDPGLSDVLVDETTGIAYIVQVIETQADRIKDEALELWKTNSSMTQQYKIKLYNDAKFKVFDKDIYDALQKNYADYLTH